MTEPASIAFLRQFFGPGNDLHLPANWRQIPQFRTSFFAFVEDLENGLRGPLLLPREIAGTSLVYAWAWSPAQGRRLAEALRAFIGPTWSDFDGVAAHPKTGDRVEAAFSELAGHGVAGDGGLFFRLTIDRGRRPQLWRAANLLRQVWVGTPERTLQLRVPIGRLLRDFDLALAAHDEDLSAQLLERIEQSRELRPANVAFLRIRRLRAFDDLGSVLRLPELTEILDLRLPQAVRDTILAAVQDTYFASFKTASDSKAALDTAREKLPHFQRLLDDVRVPPSEPAVDAWAALVAAQDDAPMGSRHQARLTAEATEWQRSLLAYATPEPAVHRPDAADRVRRALAAGHAAEAWQDLDLITDLSARLQLAVQCALTLQDPRISLQVRDDLAQARDDHRTDALTPPWFAQVWTDHISQVSGTHSHPQPPDPQNWVELLKLVLNGDLAEPLQVIDDLAPGWPSPAAYDQDLDAVLVQFDPSSTLAYQNLTLTLPRLLEQLSDEHPAPKTAATCVTLLALSDELTPAVIRALLAALRLAVSSAPLEYEGILATAGSVLQRAIGMRTVDWFLDSTDHLLAEPAPATGARTAFCTEVLTRIHGLLRRLTLAQRQLAHLLCHDLGLPLDWLTGLARTGDVNVIELRGTILLYSLQTAVLTRVKSALETLSTHLTVHASSELDGSGHLRSQVQASDVLVIATRRATHAATGAIERWRRHDSTVVYVPGAGSASMLATAVAALQTEAMSTLNS